ncbi:hypothetical protein Q5741_17470 [Paenibacillus sp. JX-17]|uniref:SHOCT domain-containing protein n=1 Tax=Paenibacillus lacisoli TaxID=3064525 RepID=A0ABT9CFZ6_9BACL|nr:hypothetical protein [Paenibacillus sp. JX-17]MDO7908195.1 hypothetical protein [Paenibacillus sp. JX-17]
MKPRHIIIVGTVVVAMTVSNAAWGKTAVRADAASATKTLTRAIPAAEQEDLLSLLKLNSEEQLHDALYNGQSLAEIAQSQNVNVEKVINLQVQELGAQLDQRLAAGSLTEGQYKEQKRELTSMITDSVYGR